MQLIINSLLFVNYAEWEQKLLKLSGVYRMTFLHNATRTKIWRWWWSAYIDCDIDRRHCCSFQILKNVFKLIILSNSFISIEKGGNLFQYKIHFIRTKFLFNFPRKLLLIKKLIKFLQNLSVFCRCILEGYKGN